jgi:hypothetical protein
METRPLGDQVLSEHTPFIAQLPIATDSPLRLCLVSTQVSPGASTRTTPPGAPVGNGRSHNRGAAWRDCPTRIFGAAAP